MKKYISLLGFFICSFLVINIDIVSAKNCYYSYEIGGGNILVPQQTDKCREWVVESLETGNYLLEKTEIEDNCSEIRIGKNSAQTSNYGKDYFFKGSRACVNLIYNGDDSTENAESADSKKNYYLIDGTTYSVTYSEIEGAENNIFPSHIYYCTETYNNQEVKRFYHVDNKSGQIRGGSTTTCIALSLTKPSDDIVSNANKKLPRKLEDTTETYCFIEKGGDENLFYDTSENFEPKTKVFYYTYSNAPGKFDNVFLPCSRGGCSSVITLEYKKRCDTLKKEAIGISPPEYTSGCDAIGSATLSLVEDIYDLMKFAIPILIVIFSIIDFVKVLLNGEEKVYKSAWSKFIKRIVIGIIILILPAVLSIVIELSGVTETYGIDNIFCIFK